MKFKIVITFLYSFMFVASTQAASQKLLFLTEHSPPFQFTNESNNVAGLTTTVIEEALKLTSYDYDMKIFPWARSFFLAQAKENTCIYLISRDKEREKLFKWVTPILLTNDYFIGLSSRTDIKVNNIEDVKKYNVAVLKEDRTYYDLLKLGFVENKNLFVINDSTSMLKLLTKRKQIDFILADTINVKYRAMFNNMDYGLFKTYFKLNKKPIELYLACSLKTSTEVINNLSQAINKIKENGTYDKIFEGK